MSWDRNRAAGLVNADESRDGEPSRSASTAGEPEAAPDVSPAEGSTDPDRTGRRSERVAAVAALLGALALAVGGRHAGVLLAVLGGVAIAASLESVHATDGTEATARGLGALGVFAGLAAVGTVAGTAVPGWPVPPLTVVALACWIGLVGTVVGAEPSRAIVQLRTIGKTTFVAVLGVGTASVLLAGQGGVTSTAGTIARRVWAPGAWVVAGPTDGIWLPFVLLLVVVVCALALTALAVTPRHVLISPRADEADVEALARARQQLSRLGVLTGGFAFFTYAAGMAPILPGSVVFGPLLRGLLLLGIVIGCASVVAGFVLAHLWDPEGGFPGSVVPTLVGGTAASLVVTAGTAAASRWAGYGLVDSLAALAGVGLLGVVALAVGAPVVLGWQRGHGIDRVLGPGALLVGAVAVAAVPGVLVAPVVVVGAALVAWDALRLHHGVVAEVPGADSLAVERRHLGATVAVALLGVVAAGAVQLGAGVVGPALGGEPLVVVVAGAVVLAGVVAVLARADVA